MPGRRSILGLAVLATILVVGGAAALIAYAWQAVDRQEALRETVLVRRALDQALKREAEETASATSWDEAYAKTANGFDRPWVDQHFTNYYRATFGHDVSLLFDPEGRLGYAGWKGLRAKTADFDEFARAARPIVARIQMDELRRRRGMDRIGPGEFGSVIWRPAFIKFRSTLYLVGVSTVAPNDGFARGDLPPVVIISGRAVDARFLKGLEDNLGIVGARLTADPSERLGTVALSAPDGRPLGRIAWSVAKPGIEVLRSAWGSIGAVALILGLTMAALAYRVRRLFIQIKANDAALQTTLRDLREARDQAQAGSIAKSQFIANISHEIRTPLNGVLGMAQVLERDDLTPTQMDRVRTIAKSGQALLGVLNDVLDISKIEAGRLEITPAPFDLEGLIEGVWECYTDVAAAKGVELTWSVAPSAAGAWLGDASRIRQILLNLVSNALKFSEGGTVRLDVALSEERLCFAIRDEGIGIAPSKLSSLFEKFSQLDSSDTRRVGGTGLGLAISRQLAVLMEGDIRVESREGEGSTFTLFLPLERGLQTWEPTAAPAQTPGPSPTDRRLRILAAEDNETNRMVLKALLEPMDADVIMVGDGVAALEAFEASDFDLILMDVQMPVMNGLDATRAIRSAERREGRRPIPILALTANALRHQIDACEAAGMTGYVSKPLQVERLYGALTAAFSASAGPGSFEEPVACDQARG